MSDVAAHARPLAPLDAGPDPDEGTTALARRLTTDPDAAVVGLGEATHGDRETQSLKGRLLRALVREREVRTLALEADVAAATAVDAYVRGGDGDAVGALGGLTAWRWRTASVVETLAWLRGYNDGRPHDEQVRVRGVDLTDPAAPARRLVALLEATDAVAVPNDLATLAEDGGVPAGDAAREHHLARAEAAATATANRVADDRAAVAGALGEDGAALVEYLADAVVRTCEWHRVRHEEDGPHEAGMAARDRHMADSVAWCADTDPGRVAVWAHDVHVGRGTFDDGTPWAGARTMGDRLAERFGDRYRALGFDVGGGRVRAPVGGEVRTVALGEPLADTLTARLAAGADDGEPSAPFALDLASAAGDPDLGVELAPEGRVRRVGSAYDPDAEAGTHYRATDLPATHDELCFLAEVTPTRPA